MLLEAGQNQEALAAFEATAKKEPNRFRGLYGAGRSAEAAGDRAKALTYYRQLISVAGEADTDRAELQHARAFVGKSGN
jgi:tetratricopeptide (TPR) repeat protein